MHAADRPCTARPSISSGVARLPEGAKPTNSEPTMLSTKPTDDPHATQAIGEAAHHHDEDAGEQRRDRHGVVHGVGLDAQVALHVRRDVQRGLGEQPERDHPEDDPEEQAVIAPEPSRHVGGALGDGVGVGRGTHACSLTESRISVRPAGAHSQADAALSMACRPVRNVGSRTGAKRGE